VTSLLSRSRLDHQWNLDRSYAIRVQVVDGGAEVDFAGRQIDLLVDLQSFLHDLLFVLVLVHVRGEGFVDAISA
jgi:hypothetical protein